MAAPDGVGTRLLPRPQSHSAERDTEHVVHDSTNDLLRGLIEQMKVSDAKLSAFIDSQERTNKELSDKLSDLNRLADSVARNSQRIASLEQESAKLARVIQDLKSAQSSHESSHEFRSENELIVSGLPPVPSISPSKLAGNVLTALGVPDLACHVLGARAIKRLRSQSSATPTSSGSVIVTLTSSAVRDAIISRKRAKGMLKASEVCGGDSNRNIHVNELLTKGAYDLLQRARRIAREKSYKYVWIKNGRICVRHADGEPIIYIDSDSDLAGID